MYKNLFCTKCRTLYLIAKGRRSMFGGGFHKEILRPPDSVLENLMSSRTLDWTVYLSWHYFKICLKLIPTIDFFPNCIDRWIFEKLLQKYKFIHEKHLFGKKECLYSILCAFFKPTWGVECVFFSVKSSLHPLQVAFVVMGKW